MLLEEASGIFCKYTSSYFYHKFSAMNRNNLVCSLETGHCCPFLLSGVVCHLEYSLSFLICDLVKAGEQDKSLEL